jgi:ribonuclease T2
MKQFITLLLLSCSFSLNALTAVTGTFEATQTCPAYASKKYKTNPGGLTVHPTHRYKIKEINKIPPDWLRIDLGNGQKPLRWVSASCGVAEYTERNSTQCDSRAGMADSHVLALSSQPGFCETYGYNAGKPECKKLSKNSYQANHLTLHGLWPNQDSCGKRYGFCNNPPQANHCDYSPLTLSNDVADSLKKLMPSFNYGSCLERHEWNKHGSCSILTIDDYFSLAMRLAREVDKTEFGQYLTTHRGDTVKLTELRELIDKSFGASNAGKIYLGCRDKRLVDIFIVLPALIPSDEPLKSLVNKAPDYNYYDSCSNSVIISDFNKETWI